MDHGTLRILAAQRADLLAQLFTAGEDLTALCCWSPDAHAPDYALRVLRGDIAALEGVLLDGLPDPERRHQ